MGVSFLFDPVVEKVFNHGVGGTVIKEVIY